MTKDEFDQLLEQNGIVFVGDAAWRVAQLVAAAALEQQEQEPVAWVGLTDEEIASIFTSKDATWWKPFARAIEAALKEKNT
jgi:hypothetical protein